MNDSLLDIPGYSVQGRLGRGGMAEVYLATQESLHRQVAIKVLQRLDDEAFAKRFIKEAHLVASLHHPAIITIHDIGRLADGRPYIAMEFVAGGDLAQHRGERFEPQRALTLIRQIASALVVVHDKGMIHRDIKPANIFAAERGGVYDVAKLLDFGLVREQAKRDGDARLTQEGSFSGSPLYMCPEQIKAYDKLDARSDVYSLGAVAYYLVTGRPPFVSENIWDIMAAHGRDPVKPPAEVNPAMPSDLESVIVRCLAKLPANRFQDVESLEKALSGCACAGQWTEDEAAAWWREVGKPRLAHGLG